MRYHGRLGGVLGAGSVVRLLHAVGVSVELLAAGVLVGHRGGVTLVVGLRVHVPVSARRRLLFRLRLLQLGHIILIVVFPGQGWRAISVAGVELGAGDA